MKRHLLNSLFVVLICVAFSSCNTTLGLKQPQQFTKIPSWFVKPVNQQTVGFIGAAAKYDSAGKVNIAGSRLLALRYLLSHHQLPFDSFASEQLVQNAKLLLSKEYVVKFLPEYSYQGVIYSYATLEDDPFLLNQQQTLTHFSNCEFEKCNPAWLCDQKRSTITGVSYFTSVPSQQLTTAKNNANLISNLLEQSHVNSMESISQTRNDLRFQVTEYSQISQVTARNDNKHNLLLSDLCEYNGTLIGNFIDLDLYSKSSKENSSVRQYSHQNLVQGRFGYGHKMSSDLLLSSAIELAIKDALIELAKIKGIHIDHSNTLSFKNGYYFLSRTTMRVEEQQVSGQLIDIKLAYDNEFPIVNVWMLEPN